MTRAAAQDGEFTSARDITDCFTRLFFEADDIPVFGRIHAVDQVMGDAPHLLLSDFGAPYVHSPVDLHGIRGDDFSVHSDRQLYGGSALAGSGRSRDDQ